MASFSQNFVLKWILNAREIKQISNADPTAPVIRSAVYQTKTFKDLRFFLEIKRNQDFESAVSINGSNTWSFKVFRAFLVTKERAYNLKAPKQFLFLNSFRPDHASGEETVTIHCYINAYPVLTNPDSKKEDLTLRKGEIMVALEDLPTLTVPKDYTNEVVINYILEGEFPRFDVDKAIKVISETQKHKCLVLKILCFEYLLSHMYTSRLQDILKTAMEYDLPLLERACTAQIAYGS